MIGVANKRTYTGYKDKSAAGLGLTPLEMAFSKGIHVEYIGRNDGGTILQNNFFVGKDGTLEEVIERYRINLRWRMESDPSIVHYLEALAAIHKHGVILVLVCHCKPLPCHGDVVKQVLESM